MAAFLCAAAVWWQSVNCSFTSSATEGTALVRNKHLLISSEKLTLSGPHLKRGKKKRKIPQQKQVLLLEEWVGQGWGVVVRFYYSFVSWFMVVGETYVCFWLVAYLFFSCVTYGQWTQLENVIFGSAFRLPWWFTDGSGKLPINTVGRLFLLSLKKI